MSEKKMNAITFEVTQPRIGTDNQLEKAGLYTASISVRNPDGKEVSGRTREAGEFFFMLDALREIDEKLGRPDRVAELRRQLRQDGICIRDRDTGIER